MNIQAPAKHNTPRSPWVGALTLCFIGLALYHPILPGSFLMDDERLVKLDNPIVAGKFTPWSIWFQADFPLSNLVFWLEWLAWGNNPAGYHVLNILLHCLGAVLLWRILIRLRIPGAWLAAALFLGHPVCVASVARIAELKNTLSLALCLLSAWAYLNYEPSFSGADSKKQSNSKSRHGPSFWLALSLIAFVLAFLSKSTTLLLPVILLACSAWQRHHLKAQDLLHTAPYFLLAVGYGLMAVWFQKNQALAGHPANSFTLWERLISAGKAFWFYLGKCLLPTNLNLVYPRWQVDAAAPLSYAPLFLIVSLTAFCWAFRRTWGRNALFALVCFVAALFPALGFFDAQFLTKWQVSDHLQYFALIVPISAVSAALATAPSSRLQLPTTLLVLVGFSLLTWERARVFGGDETLLRDTLKKNPAAWAAHNDLGCISAQKQDYIAAAEHFTAALNANPSFPDAHLNLGQTLAIQGKPTEAESHFLAVLKIDPGNSQAHRHLAHALSAQRRHHEALRHFQRALSLQPDPRTHLEFAALLYETGNPRQAVKELHHAIRLDPQSATALNNLAWLLATSQDQSLRDGDQAVVCARRACHLTEFKDHVTIGTLAAAYAESGRFSSAIATAQRAEKVALAAGDTRLAALNEQLLGLYRAGKSWHEPALSPELQTN